MKNKNFIFQLLYFCEEEMRLYTISNIHYIQYMWSDIANYVGSLRRQTHPCRIMNGRRGPEGGGGWVDVAGLKYKSAMAV